MFNVDETNVFANKDENWSYWQKGETKTDICQTNKINEIKYLATFFLFFYIVLQMRIFHRYRTQTA